MACLVVQDGWVVQSFGFNRYLPVGRPEYIARFLDRFGIDELVLIDIGATRNGRTIDEEMVRCVSSACLAPLAVGGGIRHVDDVRRLLSAGADKIVANTLLRTSPEDVARIANEFGNQCVIASIDASERDGNYFRYDHTDAETSPVAITDWIQEVESFSIGELFLNSPERDGSKSGYAIDLATSVMEVARSPVIVCGGAKHADDMSRLFEETGVSAACAANFFHFQEHSVVVAKQELLRRGQNIRMGTKIDYRDAAFDPLYRLTRKPEDVLRALVFTRVEKEII